MSLDPLAQLQLVATITVMLITVGTLLLLRRVFFLPILDLMERRAARVEAARARKAAAEAALRTAETETQEALAAATAEAARLSAGVQQEIERLRAERLARAGAEAESILARGREELAALGQTEANRLEAELCDSVSRTLATVIGPVDDSAVRFLVHRVLATKEVG